MTTESKTQPLEWCPAMADAVHAWSIPDSKGIRECLWCLEKRGLETDAHGTALPVAELKPTHRCKVCGALWISYPDSWSLFSAACGQCCDNVAMGDQIEALPASSGEAWRTDQPRPAEWEDLEDPRDALECIESFARTLERELAEARAEVKRKDAALSKINEIRKSIVAFQSFNWSEHMYPLVAILNELGYECPPYEKVREDFGAMLKRTNEAEQSAAGMRALLKKLRDAIEQLGYETGVCCCGGDVNKHTVGDGHSPVDQGAHFMEPILKEVDQALTGASGDGKPIYASPADEARAITHDPSHPEYARYMAGDPQVTAKVLRLYGS